MLLKELEKGKRFMFADRLTPLALALPATRGQYQSVGTFRYDGTAEGTCPILWHIEAGKKIVTVSNTYYRSVLPIF
jgi:hypothetical protein